MSKRETYLTIKTCAFLSLLLIHHSNSSFAFFSESNNKSKLKISAKPQSVDEAKKLIEQFEEEMRLAAENLEFEKAIALRDKILELRKAIK